MIRRCATLPAGPRDFVQPGDYTTLTNRAEPGETTRYRACMAQTTEIARVSEKGRLVLLKEVEARLHGSRGTRTA
jgi:hypothetical protein